MGNPTIIHVNHYNTYNFNNPMGDTNSDQGGFQISRDPFGNEKIPDHISQGRISEGDQNINMDRVSFNSGDIF